MPFRSRFMPMLALGLAGLAAAVGAQAPPIKPGLWEARSDREVDGKTASQPAANLQNLPPAVRAQVETRMKEKGIALGANGVNRICMTRETLDASPWQNRGTGCKTEYRSRTGSTWKWHSSCTQPPSESDGEAVFASPESYTVSTAMTMTMRGETRTMRTTIKAKWLGADCGDLKPLALQR